MSTCEVMHGGAPRNHVVQGSDSVQDLMDAVARALGKTTNEIIIMHNKVVLNPDDQEIAAIFLEQSLEGIDDHGGNNGVHAVTIQVWTTPPSSATKPSGSTGSTTEESKNNIPRVDEGPAQ